MAGRIMHWTITDAWAASGPVCVLDTMTTRAHEVGLLVLVVALFVYKGMFYILICFMCNQQPQNADIADMLSNQYNC